MVCRNQVVVIRDKITAWMNNYIGIKGCDVITHPHSNFNRGLVEVRV